MSVPEISSTNAGRDGGAPRFSLGALGALGAVCAVSVSCAGAPPKVETVRAPASTVSQAGGSGSGSAPPPASPSASDPLLAPWTGPYGGLPPFGRFAVADIGPALDLAIAEKLANVEQIAADSSAATFDNNIAALERSGATRHRVSAVYGVYVSTMSDDAVQALQRAVEPKLAAMQDAITQNKRLFQRVAAVYDARESAGLTPEQKRLVWLDYTTSVRAGAKLDDAAKKKMAEINQRLATLYATFSQNILAEEGSQMVLLESERDLDGLPASEREAAAEAATSRGKKGQWAVLNTRSSVDPFLTYSTRRDLRERVFRMFIERGDNGDVHDNNQTIAEILKLRARSARASSATRRTPTGASRTRWRRRPSVRWR